MSGQREAWVNVYHYEETGALWSGSLSDKAQSDRWLAHYRHSPASTPLYRIHVRLKPEGAPRRYATEGERLVWQDDPDWARGVIRSRSKEVAGQMIGRRASQLLRTPKTEESAS